MNEINAIQATQDENRYLDTVEVPSSSLGEPTTNKGVTPNRDFTVTPQNPQTTGEVGTTWDHATPSPRDPRIDPRPGDEVAAKLKVKVASVLLEEAGVTQVSYYIAARHKEYVKHAVTVSLAHWRRLAATAKEVLHVAEVQP